MNDTLKREVERVRQNIPGSQRGAVAYALNYDLFQEGSKEVYRARNAGCFGALAENFSLQKGWVTDKPTYLRFYIPSHANIKRDVSLRWLSLLQTMGILSSKQSPAEIQQEGLLIELSNKQLSPFDFYMQVALVRYLGEANNMVKNMLSLIAEGADFWATFFWLHDFCMSGSQHALSSTGAQGGVGAIAPVISMKRNLRGPEKIDTRSLWQILEEGRTKRGPYNYPVVAWNIFNNLRNLGLGTEKLLAEPWRLVDPNLIPVLQATSEEELAELFENFQEEHPDVGWTK